MMNKDEAKKVIAEYESYDSAFRKAKKNGDFKVASSHKAKRDALQPKLDEALKVKE
jgi:hypothetical protein